MHAVPAPLADGHACMRATGLGVSMWNLIGVYSFSLELPWHWRPALVGLPWPHNIGHPPGIAAAAAMPSLRPVVPPNQQQQQLSWLMHESCWTGDGNDASLRGVQRAPDLVGLRRQPVTAAATSSPIKLWALAIDSDRTLKRFKTAPALLKRSTVPALRSKWPRRSQRRPPSCGEFRRLHRYSRCAQQRRCCPALPHGSGRSPLPPPPLPTQPTPTGRTPTSPE